MHATQFTILTWFFFSIIDLAWAAPKIRRNEKLVLAWQAPSEDDVRGPCPMLNTLANHAYLPHSGRNITREDVVYALGTALNINQNVSHLLFRKAITTNPEPNATMFSLEDLRRHNILEHDASISRGDFFFGDDYTFNQTIFDETKSYWTSPTINVQHAANARNARVAFSQATNPDFNISRLGEVFGLGEQAAYIIVLGDKIDGTVRRSWVEYLFENERLPIDLGWQRCEDLINVNDLKNMIVRVANASGVSTGSLNIRGSLQDTQSDIHKF